MIDQRGQRRQVVCDGQRQAQGKAQDERGLSGEQRGIRLLTDGGSARAHLRVAPATERTGPISMAEGDHGPVLDPEPSIRPAPDPERPRRLRCDETHAARPVEPPVLGGRVPGPLRARIAQRHLREA
jgi:hypothetical protein